MTVSQLTYCSSKLTSAGSIPEKYYSVKDKQQFEDFLRETDVLVCSLPGTEATKGLLDAEKLGASSWHVRHVELTDSVAEARGAVPERRAGDTHYVG